MRKWLRRVLVVALALFALLWATWPWSSQITWLLPVEDELHSYMKKTQPLEADILGERAQLAAGDTAREHMDKILKDSEELLALNEEYWVQGKEQPWFRAFMYKIRGMEQPPAYLPSWPGPKDPEGKQMMVTDMPADTATLAAYAWQMKEASNALATEMIATFGDGAPVTEATLSSTSDAMGDFRKAKEGVDYIYRKWKGNYRPPLSFLR